MSRYVSLLYISLVHKLFLVYVIFYLNVSCNISLVFFIKFLKYYYTVIRYWIDKLRIHLRECDSHWNEFRFIIETIVHDAYSRISNFEFRIHELYFRDC